MSISADTQIAQIASDGYTQGAGQEAVAESKTTYRKVAILGSADSSLGLAPLGDESWELWGLPWSHIDKIYGRITLWMDPHPLEWMRGRHKGYVEHLAGLAPNPVYMIQHYEEVPNSVRYPIEDIMAEFVGYGNLPRGSFASSIAYMVALAIHQRVDEIGLWGVDLLTEGEYAIQRPNVEYLLGVAEGRGIKLNIPASSALLKGNHSYGYQTVPDGSTGINGQYLRERVLKYKNEREASLMRAQTYEGAAQVCREFLAMSSLRNHRALLIEKAKGFDKERQEAMARGQTFDGAMQEADALLTQVRHWERGGVIPGNSQVKE